MKQKVINTISGIAVNSGLSTLLRNIRKTPRVIYYHGIEDKIIDPYVQGVHISTDSFKKHLSFIDKNFEVISIDEFYERFKNNSFTGEEVIITFDDGYRNNLTVAAPILKQFKFPFTVFLSTGLVKNDMRFPTFLIRSIIMKCKVNKINLSSINKEFSLGDHSQRKVVAQELIKIAKTATNNQVNIMLEDLKSNISDIEFRMLSEIFASDSAMNWEEAKELLNYDCTLASHCVDHFVCHNQQDEDEMYNQMLESKNEIIKIQGDCDYFAYPNGTNCDLAREVAKKTGYKMAFTTKYNHVNSYVDPYAMHRLPVPLDVNRFKLMMSI